MRREREEAYAMARGDAHETRVVSLATLSSAKRLPFSPFRSQNSLRSRFRTAEWTEEKTNELSLFHFIEYPLVHFSLSSFLSSSIQLVSPFSLFLFHFKKHRIILHELIGITGATYKTQVRVGNENESFLAGNSTGTQDVRFFTMHAIYI